MAGSKNDTHYSRGYNLYPTGSPEIVLMQQISDATQFINVDGTPEGNEAANMGSVALDRTNGTAYLKVTGTGNTGWQQIATGTDVPTEFDGNLGSAVPVAGVLNIIGSGSTTTVASGNTVSTTLTGLTNHAVLVGAGTATITKLAVGTNGQVLIASTAADPAFATITSSGGTIAFTLGANTLNMEVAGGGFTWTNVTGASATLVKENGYQANNAGLVTLTMPSVASSTFGDTIKIAGFGAGGWLVQCVATQLIHMGSSATSAAGSLASTNRYDQLELVCNSTTTEWSVRAAVGNITVV